MTSATERAEALAKVDIFHALSKNEIFAIAMLAEEVTFPPNAVIATEGLAGTSFYVILHGIAKVTVAGRKRNTLMPGKYFGEMSMIDGEPRSATVTAESELQVLVISSYNFRPLLLEQPTITRKLLEGMCKRLRKCEASLTS